MKRLWIGIVWTAVIGAYLSTIVTVESNCNGYDVVGSSCPGNLIGGCNDCVRRECTWNGPGEKCQPGTTFMYCDELTFYYQCRDYYGNCATYSATPTCVGPWIPGLLLDYSCTYVEEAGYCGG